MRLDPKIPREYLIGHLEDALARDPRVTEQGLRVSVQANPLRVVVSGTVASAERRRGITEVVAELLPEAELRDATTVADCTERTEAEQVS